MGLFFLCLRRVALGQEMKALLIEILDAVLIFGYDSIVEVIQNSAVLLLHKAALHINSQEGKLVGLCHH